MVSCSKAPLRVGESDDALTNCPSPDPLDGVTTLFATPYPIWAKSVFIDKTDFRHKSTVSPDEIWAVAWSC